MVRFALFLSLVICSPRAFAGEREAVVKESEAILLAGPGGGMPETIRLKRGQRLRIHHEDGPYYAVQPPAGSIAWVRGAYLQFVPDRPGGPTNFPAAAVIDANNQAKLRPGRLNEPKPLTVERTAIPDGTAVTVIGQKVEIDGVKWYPISAPDDDFRYVVKESLEIGAPVESKFVVTSPNSGPIGVATAASASPSTPIAGINSTLWRDAQQAEQAGDWDRAEKFYLELARDMQKPGGSDKVAEACFARVHEMREKRRKAQGVTGATSSVTVPTERPKVAVDLSTSSTTSSATRRASETDAKWEGPGMLYASSLRVNNQKLYALQSNSQNVIAYLSPGPGVDLTQFANQKVRVYGTSAPLTGYPGKALMTVSKVEKE